MAQHVLSLLLAIAYSCAHKDMGAFCQVFVGTLDLAACHTVTQIVEYIEEEYKRERLYDFLTQEKHPNEKCLVFVGRKTL